MPAPSPTPPKRATARKTALACALACGIAAPFEGLRTMAYRDPVGIPTICFGSIRGVKMGDVKTPEQCKAMLTDEMAEYTVKISLCLPPDVFGRMSVNMVAAYSSAAYNVGTGLVCDPNFSTLARKLQAGNATVAECRELLKWDKARIAGQLVALPGLTKRRHAEYELCRTPDV
jgi:lysozyme